MCRYLGGGAAEIPAGVSVTLYVSIPIGAQSCRSAARRVSTRRRCGAAKGVALTLSKSVYMCVHIYLFKKHLSRRFERLPIGCWPFACSAPMRSCAGSGVPSACTRPRTGASPRYVAVQVSSRISTTHTYTHSHTHRPTPAPILPSFPLYFHAHGHGQEPRRAMRLCS